MMSGMSRLEGFIEGRFAHGAHDLPVFYKGEGPPILVMHEIPGITPEVERFANLLVERGFSVAMPELFGETGREASMPYIIKEMAKRPCIRREFSLLAKRGASPLTEYLRALSRDLHERTGEPVGAIGMCITGNFALALMVDEHLMAPVLAQPSLPLPLGRSFKRALHMSDEALAIAKRRVAEEGVNLLGLRYHRDPLCPPERFDRLSEEFGEAFIRVELSPTDRNPSSPIPMPHSPLTAELIEDPTHPTMRAFERVVTFFNEQLRRD